MAKKEISYLILEDEFFCAAALERFIASERPNYHLVGMCDSVQDSKEMLSKSGIDLIFSDICLCDGLATEAFRATGCSKPVVFVTGYEKMLEETRGLNVVECLLKPLSMVEVGATLEKFENQLNQ